jgi:ABC-2 type transport system ATP-binding protein
MPRTDSGRRSASPRQADGSRQADDGPQADGGGQSASSRASLPHGEAGQQVPAEGPAIEVSHLYKNFGTRTAVKDVSFSVARGEVFGFLGPNGAGKTTTVRVLSTLIRPTSGSAVVAGIPLAEANEEEIRRNISIMPENPGLYLKLTVAENLEFFARLYGIQDRDTRIKEALDAVDLGNRVNDLTGNLSKGLRQRAALARTLLNNPLVMFLDEPTAGLDPVAAREVGNLIVALRERGVTVFLTTHLLDEAQRLCDRVAIMNTTLATVGTPEELRGRVFTSSLVVRTAAPLSKPDKVFMGLPSVESWQDDESAEKGRSGYVLTVADPAAAAPAVTRALVEDGADVLSIAESQHSLEEVYLHLIEDKEN